jgi:hypothetical protein
MDMTALLPSSLLSVVLLESVKDSPIVEGEKSDESGNGENGRGEGFAETNY